MESNGRKRIGFFGRWRCVVAAQLFAINASTMMKLIRSVLIGVVALVFAMSTPARAAVVGIKLSERVDTASSVVRLGDVATVASDDREQSQELARLLLMPAPAPGTERYLRKREIADMMAAHGVDLRDIRFAGADQVAIGTKG